MLDLLTIYWLTGGAVGSAAHASYPAMSRVWPRFSSRYRRGQQARMIRASRMLDEMFMDIKPTHLAIIYGVGPTVFGLLTYAIFGNIPMALVVTAASIIVPDLWIRFAKAQRKRKFQAQLVDALFILSSSLRAGLSLTQALESLESEMPPPASQEFGLVIKAHRLGRPLEEAFRSLNERMSCEELNLIVTAVLVARETGGDVTRIINEVIGTIREKKKLNDKLRTLTLQSKLQAYIMSALPLLFASFLRTFNAGYFELMFKEPVGNLLLLIAAGLWMAGMVLLFRLSRVDI